MRSATPDPLTTFAPTTPDVPNLWWGRAPSAAAVWSLLYGAAALYWTVTGQGYPFGANDPQSMMSILGTSRVEVAGPVFAVVGLVGAVVALAMALGRGRARAGMALVAFAAALGVTFLLLIPDARILARLGYAFVVVLGAPFGVVSVREYVSTVNWPEVNQLVCLVGGFLWTMTALGHHRRLHPATRPGARPTHHGPQRWARLATYVAIAVPLLYAGTRLAWVLGVPLGVTEEFLSNGSGEMGAAGGLAAGAAVGALLTWGLIRPWGEIFPRWLPLLSGRPVPPAMASIPAGVVAVLVFVAGQSMLLVGLRMRDVGPFGRPLIEEWATIGPALLWPVWGIALGIAALGYHHRRTRASRGMSTR